MSIYKVAQKYKSILKTAVQSNQWSFNNDAPVGEVSIGDVSVESPAAVSVGPMSYLDGANEETTSHVVEGKKMIRHVFNTIKEQRKLFNVWLSNIVPEGNSGLEVILDVTYLDLPSQDEMLRIMQKLIKAELNRLGRNDIAERVIVTGA